jgi:hypothetical protein
MNPQWNDTHNDLRLSMQKEVNLMRDLLTNLHQEELSLLMHDRSSWNQIMEERSKIVQNLSSWRTMRMEAIHKLSRLFLEKKAQKDSSLEELLPSQDENSCEILSLRDQMITLMERMNTQNSRNQTLYQQVEKKLDLPPETLQPQPAYAPQKKKRSSVITYYKE